MTAKTRNYQLEYPIDTDPISVLPDVLQNQAERIDTLLSSFDFNGQDPDRYAARLAQVEADMDAAGTTISEARTVADAAKRSADQTAAAIETITAAIGTPRVGKFGYDNTKVNIVYDSHNMLLRLGRFVIASCRFVYLSGVITAANASSEPLTVPEGFGLATVSDVASRHRISIVHTQISPGDDDAVIAGHKIQQWRINNPTSEYSLTGVWITDDA